MREMRLLRSDVEVCLDRSTSSSFGIVYDRGTNLATDAFESRSALQQRCRDFARAKGFALRVAHSSWQKKTGEGNSKYVCKLLKGQQQLLPGSQPSCPFFFTVYGIRDEWKITKMCIAHGHHVFSGFQGETFVEGLLADDTTVTRQRDLLFAMVSGILEREMLPAYSGTWPTVKGKAIVDFLLTKQIVVSLSTASKLKTALHDAMHGSTVESYQKLESFLSSTAATNEGSVYGFDKTADGLFMRACFFPGACLRARLHCKGVVGLDGTHLKGEMNKRGVYLLATTKDRNDHILVLGLALVSRENYDNRRWFLEHFKTAVVAFEREFQSIFVSDRQKGLIAAVSDVSPDTCHRFCVRHIISNISKATTSLAPSEEGLVFAMARSECENDFKYFRSRLEDTRPNAVEYLNSIDKTHWVTYAFQDRHHLPSFDEVASNLSEAANNWLGNACRSASPLLAFEHFMLKVVEMFAARRREARRGTSTAVLSLPFDSLVPVYRRTLDDMLALAKTCHVMPCLDGIYLVRFADKSSRPGYVHLWRSVNLCERECSCTKWQDTQFPCVHAVKAAIHHGLHMSELFDSTDFTMQAFDKTYSYQFVPTLRSAILQEDTQLRIPEIQVSEGELGKRGKKPGPKPRHNRKQAKAGSASTPQVALTQ